MDIELEAQVRYPEPDQYLAGQQEERRHAFESGAEWALGVIFDQMHWSCSNPDHKEVYHQIADALGYTRTNVAPTPIQTPYDF